MNKSSKDSESSAIEKCAKRYDLIHSKVKELDPQLEVAFIPRTLYELIFIKKCIQEDLKEKKICPLLDVHLRLHMEKVLKTDPQNFEKNFEKILALQAKRKCWHRCHLEDAGDNSNHPQVKELAFRLNNVIIKALKPKSEGFTYQELLQHTEKEIDFLKDHRKNCENKTVEVSSCSWPGPTTNFGYESYRGSIKPMGIRNDQDAAIIKNALALECSKIALRAIFLYRGSCFKKDSPYLLNDPDKAYRTSFGTSLFAGCLYDGGATAWHFMRNEENAYALAIPFEQINTSAFFIPPTNTLSQLSSNGEFFHAGSKAWKGFDVEDLGGINMGGTGTVKIQRAHLMSELSKEELIAQFEKSKAEAIQLK